MKAFRWNTLWTLAALALLLSSCDNLLDQPPRGSLSGQVLANQAGVEALLVGAYGALDGQQIAGGPWETSPDNWIYGSVAAGEAHKGSDATDQPAINPIMTWDVNASNGFLNSKWRADYEGISRANAVLDVLPQVEDATDAEKAQIEAEARFLRAHYYFDLKKIFNNVPWIDENTEDYKQANTSPDSIWMHIEDDFKFAYENLPETQSAVGRVNKWAAAAYLAKTYLYEEKWQEAADLFDTVIAQGQTPNGIAYALTTCFQANFDPASENNSESVFVIQQTGPDGTGTITNSNQGDMLNFPYNSPFGCCGFYQPTQDLVNSYRVDPATGLPFVTSYNSNPIESDEGVSFDAPFTISDAVVDPRLDWTVGRRGVPYLDWGPHPGVKWSRDPAYAGPYSPKKNVYEQSDASVNNNSWAPGTSLNVPVIRFADVLLMAAEAHAHTGDLATALEYVNRVRERAGNPDCYVSNADNEEYAKAVVDNEAAMLASGAKPGEWVVRTDLGTTFVLLKGEPTVLSNWQEYTIPTYKVEPYPSFANQQDALDKIFFERKLELAMEGQRFFDLSRSGRADHFLNDVFYPYEGALFPDFAGGVWTPNKNEYYPIPQRQIDLSVSGGAPTLQQNTGY